MCLWAPGRVSWSRVCVSFAEVLMGPSCEIRRRTAIHAQRQYTYSIHGEGRWGSLFSFHWARHRPKVTNQHPKIEWMFRRWCVRSESILVPRANRTNTIYVHPTSRKDPSTYVALRKGFPLGKKDLILLFYA